MKIKTRIVLINLCYFLFSSALHWVGSSLWIDLLIGFVLLQGWHLWLLVNERRRAWAREQELFAPINLPVTLHERIEREFNRVPVLDEDGQPIPNAPIYLSDVWALMLSDDLDSDGVDWGKDGF